MKLKIETYSGFFSRLDLSETFLIGWLIVPMYTEVFQDRADQLTFNEE